MCVCVCVCVFACTHVHTWMHLGGGTMAFQNLSKQQNHMNQHSTCNSSSRLMYKLHRESLTLQQRLKAIMFKTNLGHKTLKNLHITLLVMCNLLHFSVFLLSIYLLYTFVKVCQVSWFSLPYSYCTLRGSSLQ